MRKRELEDKTAIVTGGASGIGLAVVGVFLREGASVILVDINRGALEAMAGEIEVPEGQSLLRFPVDISKQARVKELFQEEACQRADILVNNAGIGRSYSCTAENADAIWEEVLGVNLHGQRFMTEEFLRLPHRDGKNVVFITTVHTAQAFKGDAPYDASKLGLLGYMRSIALDYGEHRVRMNAVAPGFISPTKITPGNSDPEAVRQGGKKIPLGRTGTPQEVPQVSVFLSSHHSFLFFCFFFF